ncbi:hypothetical protein [Pyrococcus yayanosii]|uniref:Uncharacterized protein n=1 Tax=Pyrococcus yayanosii (strain CH1 / JCM 16557) TaxID=529709 RepID=F8AFB9_PYRYC|nr:hypothetical protein [Pyrococcus yayanosii]AEH24952.1 hypothetical protein PYCH_12800 [Pyrococcus yayanosii CH1]
MRKGLWIVFMASAVLFALTLSGLFYQASKENVKIKFLTFANEHGPYPLYSVCMKETILPFAGEYTIEGPNATVITAEGKFNESFTTKLRGVGVTAVLRKDGETVITLKPRVKFPLLNLATIVVIGGVVGYALRVLKLE